MSHLDEDVAAPFTADEPARFGQHRDGGDQGDCIVPVPKDAGVPPLKVQGREADRRFAYRDCNGDILGYVLRWDARNGTDKEIRPATYWRNGTGKGSWRLKIWPGKRPLFGLDLLAAHPDAIVLLTEGEKAAQAVASGPLADAVTWAKCKMVGVTWPGGINAIAHADFSPLAGRDVILLPDNDQPGEVAADALLEVLGKVGVKRLRRWHAPAQAKEKWDIADPVPDGVTPEYMVLTMLEAPDISTRIVKTLSEFLADFQPPDYLVDGLLQKHFCYSLTGATGAGKTAVALLICTLVASRTRGQKLGSHEVEHGRVVYIAAENPTDIRMRLIGMATKLDLNIDPRDFLAIEQIDALEKDMPRIEREIASFGNVDLVVVDTAPSLFQGNDENSNLQMRDHAKRLRKFCDLPGRPCVVALCHPTKIVSGPDSLLPRGGGSFIAEMDGNLTAFLHDGNLCDLHWIGKFRGPDFEKIIFRLTTVTTTTLTDSKGRLLPTVMARIVSEAEAVATELLAVDQEDRLLIAMHNRPQGSLVQWATDCRWFVAGDPLKPNRGLSHRVIKRLEKDKLVAKEGRDLVLTKTGKAAAKKALAQQAKPA
jgi:hypothetical protein